MKTLKPILMYALGASIVFFIFMQIGHYSGKQFLESQYPLIISITGDPSTWSADEKTVMAVVLPKCKQDNQSGNFERMKTCWINHAAILKDDGKSSRALAALLKKHLNKQK